jgi:hypothetical protein
VAPGADGAEHGLRLAASWIAAITQAETIARILEHLGLESARVTPTPPRAPP